MVELRNRNLQLLLLRSDSNGRQHLRVCNKDSRQQFLQVITIRIPLNLLRLPENLILIPVRNLLKERLEVPEEPFCFGLLVLCNFQ